MSILGLATKLLDFEKMNTLLQKQLVTQLSKDTVAKIAPEELLTFRVTKEEYFKNPDKTLQGKAESDDMIGFGAGGAELFITPIILDVAATVIVPFVLGITTTAFQEQCKDAVKGESWNLINKFFKFIKGLFEQSQEPKEETTQAIPSLTVEQVEQLTQLAFERASQLELDGVAAMKLARTLVEILLEDKT